MKTIINLCAEEGITSVAELFEKHPETWCPYGPSDTSGPQEKVCLLVACERLNKRIRPLHVLLGEDPIGFFNDAPGRTIEEIIALAKLAGV